MVEKKRGVFSEEFGTFLERTGDKMGHAHEGSRGQQLACGEARVRSPHSEAERGSRAEAISTSVASKRVVCILKIHKKRMTKNHTYFELCFTRVVHKLPQAIRCTALLTPNIESSQLCLSQ